MNINYACAQIVRHRKVCGLHSHDDSSEQVLLQPATANDAASRSNKTIGPMKIVQCAAALSLASTFGGRD